MLKDSDGKQKGLVMNKTEQIAFDLWWAEYCDSLYLEDYGVPLEPRDAAEAAWNEVSKELNALRTVYVKLIESKGKP